MTSDYLDFPQISEYPKSLETSFYFREWNFHDETDWDIELKFDIGTK